PATGRPIVAPSQDMVLGCYYLTAHNPEGQRGAGRYFASFDDVVMAYEQEQVTLHSQVWLRFEGDIEGDGAVGEDLVEEKVDESGSRLKIYPGRRVREDSEGNVLSQYVLTTPGRVIFNQAIHHSLAS
ncbi:MAG: DNA-directed RNA polymerase subunit gamma, partial [Pseudanabaena sp. SU_2_4]|nr:DNA-directed RNA polymerase subunit gamma [Pseudanabaena sp. SU_2_4]